MASTITRTKTIRIANETADYFEDKPLNRIVENVHELMKSGKASFDGQSLKFDVDTDVDTMNELEEMALCFGMTGEELLHQTVESLNEGTVTVNEGKLVGYTPWVEKFESVCHDLCIPVEKACEIAIKALRNGR